MKGSIIYTDYLERVRSLVTFQFENSVVFDKYLQLMSIEVTELQKVYKDLLELRSIDTAIGKQLDIIGKIVGQDRLLVNVNLFEFFGFEGNFHSGSFGDLDMPSVGSIFYSEGDPMTGNILLEDDLYRIFIKARIAKNVTRATPEDMMHFANFIFSTEGSSVDDEGGGTFRLSIGRPLTKNEVGLIKYINKTAHYESSLFPKPIGVKMWFSSFDYNQFFAFAGVPNAKGFGNLNYPKFDGEYEYDGTLDPKAILEEGVGGYLMDLHGDLNG